MDNLSINGTRALCCMCHKVIKDRPKTCAVCGRAFCTTHLHCLTLVRKKGTEVMYACNDCIYEHHLEVIDPNHPLYLNSKGNSK